ncbi:MAG: hypothetical protein FWH26_06940 [Oscillospiraceae bacterium]|nr:hypothetical protein [Oscillospiraceae bacterium]
MMKTLLVYHSKRGLVRAMCEASAMEHVDVMELQSRYQAHPIMNFLADCYRALTGRGTGLAPMELDLAGYDSIVLVNSLRLFSPSAECNEFLYRCNLAGREVSCVVCNRVRSFGQAGAKLRKRVRLAGGSCRSVAYVTESDLAQHAKEKSMIQLHSHTEPV